AGHKGPRHPHRGGAYGGPSTAPSPSPSTDPSPSPSPSPSPDPSLSPSPDPSPSPSPSPPPSPPDWSSGFVSTITSQDECGCDPAPHLVSSSESGKVGDSDASFEQQVTGAGLDAAGNAAWSLSLRYWGSIDDVTNDIGATNFSFTLGASDGSYKYGGASRL